MFGKKKKTGYKSKFLMFVIILVAILSGLLYFNVKDRSIKETEGWEKYAIIGKKNVFVVYKDKLTLQIPYEISVNKEETVGDIIKTGNYEETIRSLNEILPEKVENFKVITRGNIDIETKNMKKVPEISMDEKRYVLTSSLNSMFLELYYENTSDSENKNIIIDILNANGRSGYARKVGNEIKEAFSYKYNAANYEKFEQYSYIRNKDLTEDQLKELIMELDEKYIRISEEGNLPTLANIVLVLGKEQEELLEITINSSLTNGQGVEKQLTKIGYKNIKVVAKDGVEDNFVEYNEKDYYIAYKLSTKLGIKNMVENKELNDKINVFIK